MRQKMKKGEICWLEATYNHRQMAICRGFLWAYLSESHQVRDPLGGWIAGRCCPFLNRCQISASPTFDKSHLVCRKTWGLPFIADLQFGYCAASRPIILRGDLSFSDLTYPYEIWPLSFWDMAHFSAAWSIILRHGLSSGDRTYNSEARPIILRHGPSFWGMTYHLETGPIILRHGPSFWSMVHHSEAWPIILRHASSFCDMTYHFETWPIILRHDL